MATADPAAQLARVYADAEAALMGTLADQVRRAINRGGDPNAPAVQLDALRAIRRQAQRVVRALDGQTPTLLRELLDQAAELGARAALAGLAALLGATSGTGEQFNRAALDRLAASVTDLVTEAHHAILRTSTDAYRDVMLRATPSVLVGADTRRQALQRAMWTLQTEVSPGSPADPAAGGSCPATSRWPPAQRRSGRRPTRRSTGYKPPAETS
nr:phage minor capsid protein [Pseudonocardia spinosispora]